MLPWYRVWEHQDLGGWAGNSGNGSWLICSVKRHIRKMVWVEEDEYVNCLDNCALANRRWRLEAGYQRLKSKETHSTIKVEACQYVMTW